MLAMPTKYVQSTLGLSLTSSSQSRQRPVNVAQLSQKFSCFSALDLELGIPHCRFCTRQTAQPVPYHTLLQTRLSYNSAHLRSTKESLTDSVKKNFVRKFFCVKFFLGENLLGEHFLSEHFFLGEHFF